MITETLKFTVNTSDSDCPFAIKFIANGKVEWSTDHLTDPQSIEFIFNDEVEQEFTVELHINGKTSEHTVIDEQGNIVKDALVSIGKIMLGDMDISQIIYENAEYVHSFNDPNIPSSSHKFFGDVGCNGIVKFKINSPSYLWLLEHM